MYLVLVTNKQSNILEDLDTLRLLSKVVPEYCGVRACLSLARHATPPLRPGTGPCARASPHPARACVASLLACLLACAQMVDEDSVCRNAFELIFAFDEARGATPRADPAPARHPGAGVRLC